MPRSAKRCLNTLLTTAGLLVLAAAPASAQTTREVYYSTQGAWTVQSVWDPSGIFEYCAAQQAGNAGFVRIARDPTNWALGILATPRFSQGQISIDGATASISFERLHDEWNYTLLEGEGFTAVRNGLSMQIALNTGAVYTVTLRGSSAAMQQTEACMRANLNRTSQTAVRAPAAAPTTSTAPRQQPTAPARQPSAPQTRQAAPAQAQPRQVAPSPIVTGAPQPVAGQTAPRPIVGGTTSQQASFCPPGERYVDSMQLCSDRLDVLIPASDPEFWIADGCQLVVNASRFPSLNGQRFLVYRGLQCSNGLVAEIESGIGAHGGSMRLVQEPSQMGWSEQDFARFDFVEAGNPAQSMYDTSIAAAPAGAAQTCNLYLLSDLAPWNTTPNAYVFTQYHGPDPSMDNQITYGGDCGPYGSYDDATDYWQTVGDHIVFFNFGQDAFPDVDVSTLTMVDVDANGGLTVVQ